jgi:hypothetical protein
MRPYVIQEGDYLTKLAFRLRFSEEEIWSHPRNARLKELRKNGNLLAPGDILFVPDPEAPARRRPLSVGDANRYEVSIPTVAVTMVLADDRGKPFASEPYVVEGLGRRVAGETDSDGKVTVEVPVRVREVQVLLHERDLAFPVMVGDLDPVEVPTGVIGRLEHLGYFGWSCGLGPTPYHVPEGDRLREAISAFQSDHRIEPTGVMDDETRSALVAAHGG